MPDTENGDLPLIFIITGQVRRAADAEMVPFNALLRAADDDSAVRSCLEALAQEGYEEANLDQIGNLDSRPSEDGYSDAYDAAVDGEIALMFF